MTASNEERLRRVTEKVAMYLLDDESETVVKKVEELKPVSLSKVDSKVEIVCIEYCILVKNKIANFMIVAELRFMDTGI
jgi:hypothetical protein